MCFVVAPGAFSGVLEKRDTAHVNGTFGAGVQGVDYCWQCMEVGMSQKTFSMVAGVLFLVIALAHVLRIAFGASVVVQSTSIPMWASVVAVVVTGYLAYEGLRLARKSLTRV
jgi:hypothetical protein